VELKSRQLAAARKVLLTVYNTQRCKNTHDVGTEHKYIHIEVEVRWLKERVNKANVNNELKTQSNFLCHISFRKGVFTL